jgi:hypothetical protein
MDRIGSANERLVVAEANQAVDGALLLHNGPLRDDESAKTD